MAFLPFHLCTACFVLESLTVGLYVLWSTPLESPLCSAHIICIRFLDCAYHAAHI